MDSTGMSIGDSMLVNRNYSDRRGRIDLSHSQVEVGHERLLDKITKNVGIVGKILLRSRDSMAASAMIYAAIRMLVIAGVLLFLLSGNSEHATADDAKLRTLEPPVDAPRRTPGPDGLVSMLLDLGGKASYEPVSVKVHPFWGEGATQFEFPLVGPSAVENGKSAQIKLGQPIMLQATGIPEGQVVWGVLEVDQGEAKHWLPLVLGSFGPTVKDANSVTIPASGRAKLAVDMSQLREFGNTASFELTPFSSGGHSTQLRLLDPAHDGQSVDTVEVYLPAAQRTIWLEVDASVLRPEAEYTGALRTSIGEHRFIDTKLVLKRSRWSVTGSFAPILPVHGKDEIALTLLALSDQPIRGLFVSSASAAKDNFDPRNDLTITFNKESLWTHDATSPEEVQHRSIEPGIPQEILVTLNSELGAGQYEATLLIGALNVDPEKWAEAKVTLVVLNHWGWAVLTLFVAVLFSYLITKGIATAVRRRNLRQRISAIQKKSWLRRDRWGALPIVRAFARVAMADRALMRRHGFKWLSRIVTTPQLILNELEEVEARLEVLKRLNMLAIYWKEAPSTFGFSVSGIDPNIIRRAQKILRRIVDRFSQIHEGEKVGPQIISEIEALEAWEHHEHLEAGFWANLRGDIQLLLDSVQLERFEFEKEAQLSLERLLLESLDIATDDTVKETLKVAIRACGVAEQEGVGPVRMSLKPLDKLALMPIEEVLKTLEGCERETVRKLRQVLKTTSTPGTLNEMIRLEETYVRLKLIWEQRGDPDRRAKLIKDMNGDMHLEQILEAFDDEVWELLQEKGTLRIVPPGMSGDVEEYDPTDFKVECTEPKANTFLFKHGLEYEWTINCGSRTLTPITRSTTVTQFIPEVTEVKVSLVVRRGNKSFSVKDANDNAEIKFTTVETSRFRHLWPTGTPELIGIVIALSLAFLVGLQSDAFAEALEGSWKAYVALIAWGIGTDQTKNLLQNLNSIIKGEGATKS